MFISLISRLILSFILIISGLILLNFSNKNRTNKRKNLLKWKAVT